ncbi:hypothetical protein [Segatella copri]
MKQLILYIIFLMSMVFAGYGEVSAASVSFTSDALPKKDKLTKVEYDQRQSDAQLENASELAYRICSSRPQRLLPSGNMHGNQSASRLLSNRIHLLFTLLSAIEGAMEPFRQETAPIHFDVASKYYVICLRHLIC